MVFRVKYARDTKIDRMIVCIDLMNDYTHIYTCLKGLSKEHIPLSLATTNDVINLLIDH